ncbi:uncharacterized protein LOC115213486 [Argonauta hians]
MTKDLDIDTLTAYSHYLHGRIKEQLNSLSIGPGKFYYLCGIFLYFFGLICMIVGILVITLRHRHVYLINFNYKFVGPGFIVIFILCFGVGTHFLVHAKEITNKYRRKLRFRALGEYGVAVLHLSQIQKKEKQRYDLKSGHLQHVASPAPRGMTRHSLGSLGDVSRQSYRLEKSRASSQDSIDRQSGRRGRRDPNFQPRIRDSDLDEKSDGSRSQDTRDGYRYHDDRPRGAPRGRRDSNFQPRSQDSDVDTKSDGSRSQDTRDGYRYHDDRPRGAPRGGYRGMPPPRGMPPRGMPPRGMPPRGMPRGMPRGAPRGMPRGGPRGMAPPYDPSYQHPGGRGTRGGPPMRYPSQPGVHSNRRINYNPQGGPAQTHPSSRPPTDSYESRDMKVDTSSESEI